MDGQHRSHEPDLQHCAERCAAVAGCAHFSYWSDGGCHLQERNGGREEGGGSETNQTVGRAPDGGDGRAVGWAKAVPGLKGSP